MAEYFDEVVLDAEDLEKLFQAATEFVRTIRNLSDEKKLSFYALYKQVGSFYVVVLKLCALLYFGHFAHVTCNKNYTCKLTF